MSMYKVEHEVCVKTRDSRQKTFGRIYDSATVLSLGAFVVTCIRPFCANNRGKRCSAASGHSGLH